MNYIQINDIKSFVSSFELSDKLANAHFLITGATGLIGSTLIKCLLALNNGIKITCPIRNIEKAKNIFEENISNLNLIECDLIQFLDNLSTENNFDYIIHCASPTSGTYMIQHPVETYELAIESTMKILKYSLETKIKGIVYVSSIEYYGQILNDHPITEDIVGLIDMQASRSCYPLGKQAAEYLCFAYAQEYGINVKIARLTQTFGAGVDINDNRVFAQFARSIINSEDIILHTTGESSKPYCYTIDCISAILYILINGNKGEAYNVANENTYTSIRDMAEFLRENFNPKVNVRIELNDNLGYAPVTKLNLSTKKIQSLGWSPKYDLFMMYTNLIKSMKNES